jgi:hypothetical protein
MRRSYLQIELNRVVSTRPFNFARCQPKYQRPRAQAPTGAAARHQTSRLSKARCLPSPQLRRRHPGRPTRPLRDRAFRPPEHGMSEKWLGARGPLSTASPRHNHFEIECVAFVTSDPAFELNHCPTDKATRSAQQLSPITHCGFVNALSPPSRAASQARFRSQGSPTAGGIGGVACRDKKPTREAVDAAPSRRRCGKGDEWLPDVGEQEDIQQTVAIILDCCITDTTNRWESC